MTLIPKRLKQRPQWRGLPIPYIATIRSDGTPDFRVTDHIKRLSVIKYHQCQLCGQMLGKFFFFVGGRKSAEQNAYFEPACHLDCLIYAMRVCPFIVGKLDHADIAKVQAANPDRVVLIDDSYVATKGDAWIIVKADNWRAVQTQGGTILVQPNVIKQTPALEPPKMSSAEWRDVKEFLMR